MIIIIIIYGIFFLGAFFGKYIDFVSTWGSSDTVMGYLYYAIMSLGFAVVWPVSIAALIMLKLLD